MRCSTVLLTAVMLLSMTGLHAQTHLVKIAPAKLSSRNLALAYEYVINGKLGVNVNADITFPVELTERSIYSFVDFGTGSVVINSLRTGNFRLNPELRVYGKKGAPQGFYWGPFLRYARYSTSSDFTYYDGGTSTVDGKGRLMVAGGGLVLGTQWLVKDKFVIDWTLFGIGLGVARASLKGDISGPLQSDIQDFIRDVNADLSDIPVVSISLSDNTGNGSLDTRSNLVPWPVVYSRLSLGWAF